MCRLLHEKQWKILVCCIPQSFPFSSETLVSRKLQCMADDETDTCHANAEDIPCHVLTSGDLVFSDEELKLFDLTVSPGAASIQSAHVHATRKIPCLAYVYQGAYKKFIKGHIDTGSMNEDMLRAFAMALLGKGSGKDLDYVLGFECRPPNVADVVHHPYMGWSTDHDLFDMSDYPLNEVIDAFSPFISRFEALCKQSETFEIETVQNYSPFESIAIRAAHLAFERGEFMRSAQIIAGFCSDAYCISWLLHYQWDLIEKGIVIPCDIIFKRIDGYVAHPELDVGRLCCKVLLMSNEKSEDTSPLSRSELLRLATNSRLSDRALCALCASLLIGNVPIEIDCADGMRMPQCTNRSSVYDIEHQMVCLHAFKKNFLPTYTYQMFSTLLTKNSPQLIHSFMKKIDFPDQTSLYALVVILMLNHVQPLSSSAMQHTTHATKRITKSNIVSAPCISQTKKEKHTLYLARATALLLTNQVEYHRHMCSDSALPKHYGDIRPKMSLRAKRQEPICSRGATSCSVQPHFEVNMMGRFSVKSNQMRIDPSKFGRQKCRALLALLIFNPSGISTEKLSREMWPSSKPRTARHNLYSVWSILRSALRVNSDDSSPLVRENGMCRIEKGRISSDVYDVWEITQKLKDPALTPHNAMSFVKCLRHQYAGELLPGLVNVEEVNAERDQLRHRISQSLLCAAHNLCAKDCHEPALSCAQLALEVDPTNEKTYETLFALQVICGQRPQATRTWGIYNKYMDTKLGLDPSYRFQQMYQCLLESNVIQAKNLLLGDTSFTKDKVHTSQ